MKVGVRPEKITIVAERGRRRPRRVATACPACSRMSTYIGVSHQYKVEAPAGTT